MKVWARKPVTNSRKLIPLKRERKKETDRQTGRQTDRQTHTQTDRQTGTQTDRQKEICVIQEHTNHSGTQKLAGGSIEINEINIEEVCIHLSCNYLLYMAQHVITVLRHMRAV